MKVLKTLAIVTLSTAALMPNVPEPTSPVTIAFLLAWGGLFFAWFARVAQTGCLAPRAPSAGWAVAFLCTVLLSGLVAAIWDTPVDVWFRGAVPFFFLLTFFPFLTLAKADPTFVVSAVHVAAVVWLVKVSLTAGAAVPAVLTGNLERLTHGTEDWGSLTLPFSLVGLALSLFNPAKWAIRSRWILAPAFSAMPLLTVYRSQILIALALWLAFVLKNSPGRRWRVFGGTVIVMALALAVLFSTELGSKIAARFHAVQKGGASRRAEISYALKEFLESPIVGKGLGHQVPVDVKSLGDWEAIMKAGGDSVGYIHNLVAYLLMDLGLLGFVAFSGFVLSALLRSALGRNAVHAALALSCRAALVAVLTFCLVQATYRLIQTNLILAALLAVLAALPQQVRLRSATPGSRRYGAEACR